MHRESKKRHAQIRPGMKRVRFRFDPAGPGWLGAMAFLAAILAVTLAEASFLEGEALDTLADVLSWVVLFISPVVAITAFLMVHILPEKIAEKKQHPQAQAIKTLCLLSLIFGGLLWPLAWLWAYSKPVLYKLAYGTDKAGHDVGGITEQEPGEADQEALERARREEVAGLNRRIAELESKLAAIKAATQ